MRKVKANRSVVKPVNLTKPRLKPSFFNQRSSALERLEAQRPQLDPAYYDNRHKRRKAARQTFKSKEIGEPINLDDDGELKLPSLDGIKSFKTCDNEEHVAALLQRQTRQLIKKAHKAIKDGKLSEKVNAELLGQLSNLGFCGDTNQIDSELLDLAFRQLHRCISYALKNSNVAFVTIIDGAHSTSDFVTNLDLVALKRSSHATLSAMADNYLAFVDVSLFNTHTHEEGGRIMSFHTHALIWGDENTLDRAHNVASKHAKRFKPNFSGAKPIDIQRCSNDEDNLARLIGYMMKPAYRCQSFYPGNGVRKGNTHHSSKGDRHVKYLRLLQLRTLLTWEQTIFGKGEGHTIRKETIKYLKQVAKTQAKTVGTVLHKDALLSWWSNLYAELKLTRYKLPVIKTRA